MRGDWKDQRLTREHQSAALREAEQVRLAQQAITGSVQPARPAMIKVAREWLGVFRAVEAERRRRFKTSSYGEKIVSPLEVG